MSTIAFAAVITASELALLWVAYTMGFQNGWLNGWDQRGKP